MTRQRVAVVTGGGRGIGAGIAEEIGRAGTFVVTVDPLVALDGTAVDASSEPSTAERIVAAGGAARASSVSVTDSDGVEQLFAELVNEFGAVDAVVNVAGISRPSGFATGDEADWRAVLDVHVNGYRNVLHAALPRMAEVGHGRIVGVTSGSGWRAADAGAYSAAKRAVAALTWQIGVHAPAGVTVNALSPVALTRMVTAALARAGGGPSSASGGLALGTGMPAPEEIGPLGAHLVAGGLSWCSGQIVFAGGSELAVIDPPRLLEVVDAHPGSAASTVASAVSRVLIPAHAAQLSTGGGNARLGAAANETPAPADLACGVIVHDSALAAAVSDALLARGVTVVRIDGAAVRDGFEGAATELRDLVGRAGRLDALVVGLPATGVASTYGSAPWAQVLAEHEGVVAGILTDAAWARAAADHAARTERPLRLVVLTDATTSGGRSRAQAAAQVSRAARGATGDRVTDIAIAIESRSTLAVAGELAAHAACDPEAAALSGADLVVGAAWFGLRRHPRPGASFSLGGTELPPWLDDVLKTAVIGNAMPAELVGGTT